MIHIDITYTNGTIVIKYDGNTYVEVMKSIDANILIAGTNSDKPFFKTFFDISKFTFKHDDIIFKTISSRTFLINVLKQQLELKNQDVLGAYEDLNPVITDEKIVITWNNRKYELLGKYNEITPDVFGVATLNKKHITLHPLIDDSSCPIRTFTPVSSNYQLAKNKIEDKIKEEVVQKMRVQFINNFQTHVLDAIYKDDVEFLKEAHKDANIKMDKLETYITFANIGEKKNTHEFLLSLVAQSLQDKLPQESILPKKEEEKKEAVIPITGKNNVATGADAGVNLPACLPGKSTTPLPEILIAQGFEPF
jgi:hypothetical protein